MARPTTKLQEIERAALRLFAAHGLLQVTTKDIAREAKCAEGALYRHYTSKNELAWALFQREVETFSSQLTAVWFVAGSFRKKLRAGIELFYRFFDKDPVLFSFILLTQHDFPKEKKLRPDLNPDNLVVSFIKEGMKQGEFRVEDPETTAAMIQGLVYQPAMLHAKGRLKGSMTSRVDQVTQACLQVLNSKS